MQRIGVDIIELEEAKDELKTYCKVLCGKHLDSRIIAMQTVLKALDNSISKEVIEQEIEKYKLLELESFNRDSIQANEYKAIIKELQELLEGK